MGEEETQAARVDTESLANGSFDAGPCASCGKTTRSHLLFEAAGEWGELDDAGSLNDLEPGTEVRFVLACHSCYTDLPEPNDLCLLDFGDLQERGEVSVGWSG